MKKFINIGLIAFVLALIGVAITVNANPSSTYPSSSTAAATSSVTTLGTGTNTTLITDAFSNGRMILNNKAIVMVQNVASTSASQLDISVSYSWDGIDYFTDGVNVSTTTAIRNLNSPNSYRLNGNTTSSTTRASFMIDLPIRYAKVTFSQTTGTSTIWANIIPQKENN